MEAQGKQVMEVFVKGLKTLISPKREKKNLVSVSGIRKERNERIRPLTVKIDMSRGKRLSKRCKENKSHLQKWN